MNQSPNLQSGIDREFKKAFVLDEDGLRRVAGVLEEAARTIGFPTALVYYVKRDDDRFYETTKIEDVFSDPNVEKKRINALSLELRDVTPGRKPAAWERDWIVAVIFHRKISRQVSIRIQTENRNWALLLADNLEPQILRLFGTRKVPTWLLVALFIFISFSFCGFLSLESTVRIMPGIILTYAKPIILIAALILGIDAAGSRPAWMKRIFGPESVFLWGDESNKYKERDDFRKIIFTGVILTFVVSVVANIYTASLFSSKQLFNKQQKVEHVQTSDQVLSPQ